MENVIDSLLGEGALLAACLAVAAYCFLAHGFGLVGGFG